MSKSTSPMDFCMEVTDLYSVISLRAAALVAVDQGTTIAVVLALITLIGTISGHIVLWHKVRVESKTATAQFTAEQRSSEVKLAQDIMADTVVVLNERLKAERADNEARMESMRAIHARELEMLKDEGKRAVARLERKIDRLSADLEACKTRNEEQAQEIATLKNKG